MRSWPERFPVLSDGVVTLGPWSAGDIDWIADTCTDEAIQQFTLVPMPYRRDDAVTFVSDICPYEFDHEIAIHLCIADARSAERLGSIALEVNEVDTAQALFGYWLHPDARGRGIASRALALMLDMATTLGFESFGLHIFESNLASQAVATAAGFRYVGAHPEREIRGGRDHVVLVYELRS